MNKELSITDKIKTFEDACKALGLDPANLPVVDMLPEKDRKSIISYYKLTIIIRALNEGWEPNFSDWNEYKYCNWFYLNAAGFAYAHTFPAASSASATVGSRLCFKTSELARYAHERFRDLYLEYMFIDSQSYK
ncbi:hypothetical protein EZS27_000348 [termite gut metagenome]|uniref:Uncharacterized protein n=1 Tax=termite gut metagenome TaxID=433724 RepID=A0A5J4T2R3_9ZZZZ